MHKNLLFKLGMCAEPFDRKAFIEQNFHTNDIAYIEDDPIANQIKCSSILQSVNFAEATHNANVANRRALIVALISILSMLVSAFVCFYTGRIAHQDSESSTAALVKALHELKSGN